jgi:hypothetical protein
MLGAVKRFAACVQQLECPGCRMEMLFWLHCWRAICPWVPSPPCSYMTAPDTGHNLRRPCCCPLTAPPPPSPPCPAPAAAATSSCCSPLLWRT